ncbi:Brix-domain-containing protein [Lophium mytilinum]|uniref:Ribosome production factor 2 homolog n=1 Tax=Lophium mytilinum TaxID=390894 RepID=A0A6A6R3T5_9PEZI|nr:Brix-domain-containing protein [Lophium mytilinum]
MLRTIKPKTARTKRILEKREPQVHENVKQCLFLKGTSSSEILKLAVTDLNSLLKPHTKKFTKPNPIHPFESVDSLNFLSLKNDCSHLVLSHHKKKRPHTLTFIRTFAHTVLDMLELHIDPETFRTISQFKNKKCAVGLKPMLAFSGTPFEGPVESRFTLAKSMLLDFFRGVEATGVDVEGLQYMIHFSASDEIPGEPAPIIRMRVYLVKTRRSGQKVPRVEVEEMGPRIDFTVGREQVAEEAVMKTALKKPKGLEPRTKKNITTDVVGDKMGKIHLGKQDFANLQTRKMKGLKRSREERKAGEETDAEEDGGVEVKRVQLEA